MDVKHWIPLVAAAQIAIKIQINGNRNRDGD